MKKIKLLLPSVSSTIGALESECINTASLNWQSDDLEIHSTHKFIRIFRNHEKIRYSNRIHESIESALDSMKLQRLSTHTKIYHLGYAGHRYREKIKRNHSLINEAHANYLKSPWIPHQILSFIIVSIIGEIQIKLEYCLKLHLLNHQENCVHTFRGVFMLASSFRRSKEYS